MEGVEVRESGFLRLKVVLEPRPIPLDGVTGRANRPGEHHEMSYAGFYMRHRESPSVGSNRVILRTDPELRVIATVLDLLYNFRPAEIGCPPIIFWNGFSIGKMPPDEYLDISSNMVEGIEYYRDLTVAASSRTAGLSNPNDRVSAADSLTACTSTGYAVGNTSDIVPVRTNC